MPAAFENYFRSLRGKKIAVLGLGVSNCPLVRLLLEFGCNVTGCDRTPREALSEEVLELERLGATLRLGEHYLEDVEADVVFRTPGMHPGNPAIVALQQKGARITSEMDAFFEVCPCKKIAVTGSDGKTTTTTLISEILKASGKKVWLGGNIGTPLLPLCRQMREEDIAVVELSSFQLMDMTRSAEVAVITNLSPNHLDVHKDMAEYVEAKKNVYLFQNSSGKLVINGDNAITAPLKGNGTTVSFARQGKNAHVTLEDGFICRNGKPVLKAADILIPGVHNVENYMAAIAAVEDIATDEAICHVAKTFGGVEHRIELVRVKDGVKYYNDSIASSPTRTIAGLRSFSQQVILIAGGYDKNIPCEELGEEICLRVKALFLNGATAPKLRAAVEHAPSYRPGCPEIIDCGDLQTAIAAAAAVARDGDIVLMSPAGAAFDQFKNFAVRGKYFKKAVMEL